MLNVKVSNAWKKVKLAQVKVSGSWKSVGRIQVKVSGSWKNIWTYSWTTGTWGDCSKTCGGGTQTRTVTCTRKENGSTNTTVADTFCTKLVGTKPATSQSCNTQSCTTCHAFSEPAASTKGYAAMLSITCDTNTITTATFYWNNVSGSPIGQVTSNPSTNSTVTVSGYKYSFDKASGKQSEWNCSQNINVKADFYKICRTAV